MVFSQKPIVPKIELPNYESKGSKDALWLLKKELSKGADAKIAVYGDPDIDGLFAGLIAEEFLNHIGYGRNHPNYRYFLNENRAHGFFMSDDELRALKGYLLIAVDFSITPVDFYRLLSAGVSVIVLDHHEINVEDYSIVGNCEYVACHNSNLGVYGVILNNQYKSEPQEFRFLSGAGVVYYFIKYALKDFDGIDIDPDYPAVVGITLLSDIRELETPQARSFLRYLFSIESDYIKFLRWIVSREGKSYQRFEPFGVPKMNRSFIDFTFSPIINSLLRANKGYEAMDLLRNNNKVVQELRAYDSMWKIRDIQKKIISSIQNYADEQESIPGSLCKKYSNMQVICLPSEFKNTINDSAITNFIGVACSRIKDEDKTGFIFVMDSETHLITRGSVRGGVDGVDYLEIFKRNNIPCAGHHNAFGVLSCNVLDIDFDALNEDIRKVELEFIKHRVNTRSVIDVNNLKMFITGPMFKPICKYNELSRDNYRIYVRYIGDREPRCEKISDNYKKYFVDDVVISCFDSTLTFENGFIQISFSNGKYVDLILRPSFEYDVDENENISIITKKIQSLEEKF